MNTHLNTRSPRAVRDANAFGVPVVDPKPSKTLRIAVVAARFNAAIVDALIEGALRTLAARGVAAKSTLLVRVAGAWELPMAAQALIAGGRHHAIIALGCVIRGETGHYEVIVEQSARALMDASLASGVPIANGVLACENAAQARARAGGKLGNKGEEAALAALEMAALLPLLARPSAGGSPAAGGTPGSDLKVRRKQRVR